MRYPTPEQSDGARAQKTGDFGLTKRALAFAPQLCRDARVYDFGRGSGGRLQRPRPTIDAVTIPMGCYLGPGRGKAGSKAGPAFGDPSLKELAEVMVGRGKKLPVPKRGAAGPFGRIGQRLFDRKPNQWAPNCRRPSTPKGTIGSASCSERAGRRLA
jgi:hypothetical protein